MRNFTYHSESVLGICEVRGHVRARMVRRDSLDVCVELCSCVRMQHCAGTVWHMVGSQSECCVLRGGSFLRVSVWRCGGQAPFLNASGTKMARPDVDFL